METEKIKIDGDEATEKIIKIHKKPRYTEQINLILLQGTTIAGLNIIDIHKIQKETEKPVITTLKQKPSKKRIKKAIKNTENSEKKLEKIEKNPEYQKHPGKNLHYTSTGMKNEKAEIVIERLIHRGNIPEPLRIASVIAKGITKKQLEDQK